MNIKSLLFGIAGLFLGLLIAGAIFAIKAASSSDSASAPIVSSNSAPTPTPSPQPAASPAPASRTTPNAPAASPLAALASPPAPAPAASPAPQPQSSVSPAALGYTSLASTETGATLFAQRPDASTPQAAILAALHDLAKILDTKPVVQGAFADAQSQHRGGATFVGAISNHPVKGTIMVGIGDKGAAVTILYDQPDAPAANWSKLTAALPLDTEMQQQSIGEGAGTISVPADWKIVNSSNLGSVFLKGPANQSIALGLGLEVVTPDSMGAATQNQLAAQGLINAANRMLVAPFTGPEEALKNLSPQISEISQARGGPGSRLDEILKTIPVQAQLPSGQAARINYKFTQIQNGQETAMRAWAQVECYPVGAGTWGVYCSSVAGPDSTFDADLPVMLAITNSWKLNDAVVNAHSQQNIAMQNARFQAFEHAQQEKQDAFEDYLHHVQHNEVIRERSNADFDEVIRGYRTVYDAETGERGSVDLGNVNEIVDKLNEGNPGRYVQIPLRDEEFPLTAPNQ
jgi:hypothetical protein